MKRPRTVFGPFVVVMAITLAVLLGRAGIVEDEAESAGKPVFTAHAVHKPIRQTAVQTMLSRRLIIPVEGVTRENLTDTWGAARSGGRSHEGIDIMAPRGTPVLAVADGEIAKFHDSVRGGISIYQFDQDRRLIYYYAHLDSRAANLEEGQHVLQGDVLGYVGSTGNAPAPHLHFEIQRMTQERRWWVADSVNPYGPLMSGNPPSGGPAATEVPSMRGPR